MDEVNFRSQRFLRRAGGQAGRSGQRCPQWPWKSLRVETPGPTGLLVCILHSIGRDSPFTPRNKDPDCRLTLNAQQE